MIDKHYKSEKRKTIILLHILVAFQIGLSMHHLNKVSGVDIWSNKLIH